MNVKPVFEKLETENFLKQYLHHYGITNVSKYLKPNKACYDNWHDYPNMETAVQLLGIAIDENWKIGVLVDADVDGMMSGSMMVDFLQKQKANVNPIFHTEKAHGLSDDVFTTIYEIGFDLLIIPDAGTNDTTRCKHLSENGTQIIVLDHHVPETNNEFAIVVNQHLNPNLNQCISGTGVTYKFIQAYCDLHGLKCPNYNDMVAVSLIADNCDLTTYENRAFVQEGLSKSIVNPAIQILFDKYGKGTTPKCVSWGVAPKINALYRVLDTQSIADMFDALIGIEIEKGIDAGIACHKTQTNIAEKIAKGIEDDPMHKAVFGFIECENKAYSGLIANKVCDKTYKPSFILRDNGETWLGSMRSPIPLLTKVNDSGLAHCSGHEQACGIVIDKDKFDAFVEWTDGLDLSENPDIPITASINPNKVNKKLCEECGNNEMLWGTGLPEPVFHIKTDVAPKDVIVFKKKTNTVRITLNGVNYLKFRVSADEAEKLESGCTVEMLVTLGLNEYKGYVTTQGMISQWELSNSVDKDLDFEDIF